MNAEILCVGTELLHGDIVNTNAAFLSKELAKIGIDVHYQTVVGDNPKRMKEAYDIALNRADVIISTGGLGPTQDDITKEIVAEYFGLPMIYDEGSYQHLVEKYMSFHKEMPKNNLRQAYFPEGSMILTNDMGTANACIVEQTQDLSKKIVVLLPGPPFEMKPLMINQVVPHLHQYSKQTVVACKIIVTELGESLAEEMVLDIILHQTNPTIATYAGKGQVTFRITAKAETEQQGLELIEPVKQELLGRFGENATVIASDKGLEAVVAELLLKKNLTIATAESCTGGMLAAKLIDYPGISDVYREGFVTYTEESKESRLSVSAETLEKNGVVSEEVAKEMAKGVSEVAGTDIGVGITGLAGPNGGTEQTPIGTVYVAIYDRGEYFVKKMNRFASRNVIRERAVTIALDELRRILLQKA